jgi:hypothetical protein
VKASAHKVNDHGREYVLVYFLCPGCNEPHAIEVGVWTWNGSEDKPTFTPSVLVNGREPAIPTRPRCHSYVTEGRIQFLADSTHALAGQTVDLPDVPEWLQ